MQVKTLLYMTLGLGAAFGLYWVVKNMHLSPKQKQILIIMEKDYANLEDGFVKAWSDAVMSNSGSFTYNNKTYNSTTGKAM